MVPTRQICFLVSHGVRILDIAGPMEVFTQANRRGGNYRASFLTVDGESVRSSSGLQLPTHGWATSSARWDTVIIGGADGLARSQVPADLVAAAQHLQARSRRTVSISTGAFILGAAGLLDGRRSTTNRRHLTDLARQFPRTHVVHDQPYVTDRDLFTSAGAGNAIDLSLALIDDDHGGRLARVIADVVTRGDRPLGGNDASASAEGTKVSALRRVIEHVSDDPTRGYSVEELARIGQVSPRHLTRLFHNELGTTPMRYVEDVRLDRARLYLETGHPITRAAELAGFGGSESMRRAFANRLRVSPRQYQRLSSGQPPEQRPLHPPLAGSVGNATL